MTINLVPKTFLSLEDINNVRPSTSELVFGNGIWILKNDNEWFKIVLEGASGDLKKDLKKNVLYLRDKGEGGELLITIAESVKAYFEIEE